jgi:very-short-patch-repair endonuclease
MTHRSIPPKHRASAKQMRHAMTEPELRFWNAVRAHRLMKLGFRRQVPIAGYIVDFACPSRRLVVEIDGAHHGDGARAGRDVARTACLEEAGWQVVRFWNDEVMRDIEGVCRHVLAVINEAEG